MQGVTELLPPVVVIVFVAILGLIFGSFATALSYRLPRGISIAKGRSACPACGTSLGARDLLPIFSWLANRGTCRACGAKVSRRYPAIELTMGTLFVIAALVVDDVLRLTIILAATPIMVTLAVVDIEHQRLPNVLTFLLAVAALAFRYVTDGDFVVAAISAVVVFAAALALDRVGRRFLRQGLGVGDAKLMAVAALALPLPTLLLALGGAGALGVFAGLLLRRGHDPEPTQVPFGPAILACLWVGLAAL